MTDPTLPNETPNVRIEDPGVRRSLSKTLFFVTILSGIAALFFQFFPCLFLIRSR